MGLLLPGFFLLLMGWLQPMHIFPWLGWHSELLGFLAVLAMGWAVVFRVAERQLKVGVSISLVVAPFLLLMAILCLQWTGGMILFGGDVIVYLGYLWLCVLGISIGFAGVFETRTLLIALAGTLVAGSVCSAMIAFAQAFEVWDTAGWIHRSQHARRPGANLAQPNQLATLLVMGIVSIFYLREQLKKGGLLAATLLGVLVVALAATESKSGMLSFLVLVAWWSMKRKTVSSSTPTWAVATYGLSLLIVFWLWPILIAEALQYELRVTAFNHPAALNRWVIWPQLLQALMMRPWLGWGFGQVATAHNAVVDAYSKSEIYTYAHNVGLDFALGLGLPLAIIFVLMVVFWFWRRLCATRDLNTWYCIAVVTPVAVHSMVEYPFAYSYFLLPVMIAIGLLERQLGKKPIFQIGAKMILLVLMLATAALVWLSLEYIAIEEDLRVARFEALHVGKTPANYQRPDVKLLTQLDTLSLGWRIVPRPNMPEAEIEIARAVALHFPMIATQNRYALSLALNDKQMEAVRQLRVMRAQQGIKTYLKIKEAWEELAEDKYPQLRSLSMP